MRMFIDAIEKKGTILGIANETARRDASEDGMVEEALGAISLSYRR